MNEKVVVNVGMPHCLPEFQNSIYRFALEKKKRKLREGIISRIKYGKLESGLYELIIKVAPLNYEEKNQILANWFMLDLDELLFLYKFAILQDHYETIRLADEYYLQNKQKNAEKLGRG